MDAVNMFISNYKTATSGLSIFTKIIIALVLLFIFGAVIYAFVGVLKDFSA